MTGIPIRINPLKPLSDVQVREIDEGTMQVLARTGVLFEDDRARAILADHGCHMEEAQKRVRFPRAIVERYLELVPQQVELRAPQRQFDVIFGQPDTVIFINSGGKGYQDLTTGERRDPTRREFYDFVKVLDRLPHVHALCPPYSGFTRVPQVLSGVEGTAAMLRNSCKVKSAGMLMDSQRWSMALAEATGQELFYYVGTQAPLYYSKDTIADIYFCCEHGLPFEIESGSLTGASAPVTTAGAIIASNAQLIAGLVFTQMLRPGQAVWPGSMIFTMNMTTGEPAFGAVGNCLIDAAYCQMWRHYNIPAATSTAGMSIAKTLDFQAGMEMSQAVTIAALSGAAGIFFQGGLSQQITAHPAKAVLDDDIMGRIAIFLKGVDTSETAKAVDLIDMVGPAPGQFLTADHTLTWWRQEQYLPIAADQTHFDGWLAGGRKRALDYAGERVEALVNSHKSDILSPSQEQAVEDILSDARKYYRKKGLITAAEWQDYQRDLASPNYPFA